MRLLTLASLLCLACACGLSRTTENGSVLVRDLVGAEHQPLEVEESLAHVLVFVTTDCPIANGYAPEFRRLVADYAGQGIRFYFVHVDRELPVADALAHATDYGVPDSVVIDREHALVLWTGAEVTPECSVIVPGGRQVYRGRVDDLYADLGKKRPRGARNHDLRAALDAVVAGREVPVARTEAVGCFIPDRPAR